MGYDAFISYSHGSDLDLAKVTRDGLQKLAKPWNRRRALDIFLDQSSLELSSELGSSLHDRIEDTDWLILFMSEASAGSKWVGAEISEWAEKKSKDKMALVLTSGEIEWDDEARDFDYTMSTAVNAGMRGVYTGQDSEPLYLDMRWTKDVPDGEASLGLDDVRFRDAIATISAAIQGKSKDEVEGDDIRAHRRLVRIRRIAVTTLVILLASAVIAGIIAFIQRQQAIEEADRATSRALASDSQTNVEVEPDLAALLALESVRVANTPDARGSLAQVLSTPTRFLQRSDEHGAPVSAIAFSSDGSLAATGDVDGVIRIWNVNEQPFPPPQATLADTELELAVGVQDLFVEAEDDGALIGAFDAGGNLTVRLSTGQVEVLERPAEFVAVALNQGEESLLAGLETDGYIRIYELSDELEFTRRSEELFLGDIVEDISIDVDAIPFAFSPDGATLAVGFDTDLVLWDWRDPEGIRTDRLGSAITSIAFSPDGSTDQVVPDGAAAVAVGEASGNIRLYARHDLTLSSDPDPGLFNTVFDLAFKPAVDEFGEFPLASAHANGEIILWSVLPGDIESPPFGYEVESLAGHKDEARSIAFSPTGRIASGDFEGEVIFWLDAPLSQLGTGRLVPGDDPPPVGDVAFVSSERVVASDANGTAWTWDISEPGVDPEQAGEGLVALDAEADTIAVLRDDGSVAVFDAAGTERVLGARVEEDAVVALSDDGNTVVVATREAPSDLIVWDIASDSSSAEPDLPESFEAASLLVADGTIWVGGREYADDENGLPAVYEVDAATSEVRGPMIHSPRAGNAVHAMAVTPSGAILATGGGDRKIVLWNTASLEKVSEAEFSGHRGILTGIAFWDDGATMISSDDAGDILLWDVSQQRLFGLLEGPTRDIVALEANVDSNTLLAASGDASVWTWTLDPVDWRDLACQVAARNMTETEWELYGSGGTRVRHCPENEIDDGAYRDATYGEALTD